MAQRGTFHDYENRTNKATRIEYNICMCINIGEMQSSLH